MGLSWLVVVVGIVAGERARWVGRSGHVYESAWASGCFLHPARLPAGLANASCQAACPPPPLYHCFADESTPIPRLFQCCGLHQAFLGGLVALGVVVGVAAAVGITVLSIKLCCPEPEGPTPDFNIQPYTPPPDPKAVKKAN